MRQTDSDDFKLQTDVGNVALQAGASDAELQAGAGAAGLQAEEPQPREQRYESCHPTDAVLLIERRTEGAPQSVAARLLDISPGGAKLAVEVSIPFDQLVRLKINLPNRNLELVVTASVCWTRPAGEDGWLVGCAFQPRLPEETLDELANGGYLERRTHSRFPLVLRATACWELGEPKVAVRLQDASDGGFAMLSPQPGETGRRVLLQLSFADRASASVRGAIQWQVKAGDQYLIGCSFISQTDLAHFRLAAWPEQAPADSPNRPRLGRSPQRIFAAVTVAALLIALFCFLARGPNEQAVATPAPRRAVPAVAGEPVPPPTGTSAPAASREATPTAPGPADVPIQTKSDSKPAAVAATPLAALPAGKPLPAPLPVLASRAPQPAPDPVPEVHPEPAPRAPARHEPAPAEPAAQDDSPPVRAEPMPEVRAEAAPAALPAGKPPASPAPQPAPAAASRASQPAPQASQPAPNPLPEVQPEPAPQVPAPREPAPAGPAAQDESPPVRSEPVSEAPAAAAESAPPPPARPAARQRAAARPRALPAEDPADLFAEAGELYRRNDLPAAVALFRRAAELDRHNALYLYLAALAEYRSGRTTAAHRLLAAAIQLEQSRPINNWGTTMQRYQGRARLWLETGRAQGRAGN